MSETEPAAGRRRRSPKRQQLVIPKSDEEMAAASAPVAGTAPTVAGLAYSVKLSPTGQLVSQRVDASAMSVSRTELGYPLDIVRSALQKALRRGQADVAAWWAWQLLKHGWVQYLWKTLAVVATEDVGTGDPMLVTKIHALYENAKLGTGNWAKDPKTGVPTSINYGMWEMQAVIMIAEAPKDWRVSHLFCSMLKRYAQASRGEIALPQPADEALDAHTQTGRRMGRKKMLWWDEGDALEPKAPTHYANGGTAVDEWSGIHGDPEVAEM
jgi:hypothetical protein